MCAACTVDLSTQLYLLTSCLILVAGANRDFVKTQEYGYEGSWVECLQIFASSVGLLYKENVQKLMSKFIAAGVYASICNYYVH